MERLTEKHCKKSDGYYMKCSEHCFKEDFHCEDCTKFDNLVDRLGAIEDILGDDYDLDRLRELVEADRDGRCVKKIDNRDIYMDRDCQHFTPATNADRIRSMTDEELLDFMIKIIGNAAMCKILRMEPQFCTLEWLKQPAKDE